MIKRGALNPDGSKSGKQEVAKPVAHIDDSDMPPLKPLPVPPVQPAPSIQPIVVKNNPLISLLPQAQAEKHAEVACSKTPDQADLDLLNRLMIVNVNSYDYRVLDQWLLSCDLPVLLKLLQGLHEYLPNLDSNQVFVTIAFRLYFEVFHFNHLSYNTSFSELAEGVEMSLPGDADFKNRQLLVCNAITRWILMRPDDFSSPEMQGVARDFAETIARDGLMGNAKKLTDALPQGKQTTAALSSSAPAKPLSLSPSKVVPTTNRPTQPYHRDNNSVLLVEPVVISQALTGIDAVIFSSIEANIITDPAARASCAGLKALKQREQNLSKWVTGTILLGSDERNRSQLIARFIEIASALHTMKNQQSCFAIIIGLQAPICSQLSKTWALVSAEVLSDYSLLCELYTQGTLLHMFLVHKQDNSGSCPNLFDMISSISDPCIPHLATFLAMLDKVIAEAGTAIAAYHVQLFQNWNVEASNYGTDLTPELLTELRELPAVAPI